MTTSRSNSNRSYVFVGADRFQRVTQMAIDLSAELRVQVKPVHLVQFLIDEYAEYARTAYAAKLSTTQAQPTFVKD
jgi:hypothetical protein